MVTYACGRCIFKTKRVAGWAEGRWSQSFYSSEAFISGCCFLLVPGSPYSMHSLLLDWPLYLTVSAIKHSASLLLFPSFK